MLYAAILFCGFVHWISLSLTLLIAARYVNSISKVTHQNTTKQKYRKQLFHQLLEMKPNKTLPPSPHSKDRSFHYFISLNIFFLNFFLTLENYIFFIIIFLTKKAIVVVLNQFLLFFVLFFIKVLFCFICCCWSLY